MERIYDELEKVLGGDIDVEPSDDMSLPEAIQYLVNQREKLDIIIKNMKQAHLMMTNNIDDGSEDHEEIDGETAEKEEKDCETEVPRT
jgi:hypothetical protein